MLSDTWIPIIRGCSLTTTPMEMVLLGSVLPRHGRLGMGIFKLAHKGNRIPPQILEPVQPLCHVAEPRCLLVDCRADDLCKVMELLKLPELQGVTDRAPTKSVLTSKEIPRVCMQWVLPDALSDMEVLMCFRYQRGQALPLDAYYGFKSLFTCKDAMILEFSSVLSTHHYWALCTQMIPLSTHKALVISSTEAEVWVAKMDFVMQNDSQETAVKLRWKASRHAGRCIATPAATSKALAASKRRGTTSISVHNFTADAEVCGEVGKELGQIMAILMQHVMQASGLNIKETDYARAPKVGEYIHLATQDITAPLGKMKVLLSSEDDVRRLYNALHGQTIAVGSDTVGIVVGNELIDGQTVPGNGQRSWK